MLNNILANERKKTDDGREYTTRITKCIHCLKNDAQGLN
ncbi:hypothetical protein GCHA_0840 [Paraglaciecola chathamensis S18K6]|uniref:Uncharacterized protein n=2 Tax=Paraglaciecola chathamensis TaxID=368405 RepID=A0ABQ0I5B1_9ALTE|nr:hypothetical protein GAGA_1663 [Paraglaciecola agarilytica NO2]GAC08803.1 hypothetical protein GCHA_0840 [Paraglaciecola chathamensis S18K6]